MNSALRFLSDFADGIAVAWGRARFEMLVRSYRRKARDVFFLALRLGVNEHGAPWMTPEELDAFQRRTAADVVKEALSPGPRVVKLREPPSEPKAWEALALDQRARALSLSMGERRIARALGTTRHQVRVWLGREKAAA